MKKEQFKLDQFIWCPRERVLVGKAYNMKIKPPLDWVATEIIIQGHTHEVGFRFVHQDDRDLQGYGYLYEVEHAPDDALRDIQMWYYPWGFGDPDAMVKYLTKDIKPHRAY
jgi:hypothetical protein